jgi:hypothetical protein
MFYLTTSLRTQLKADRPHVKAVAIDASPTMLKSARGHFANDPSVKILLVAVIEYEVHHNLVVIHRLWEWK